MRLALFSDVHGNLTALEAVLADIGAQEGIGAIVFAGDLCVFGPRPNDCIERVRFHKPEIAAIYGNTDEWLGGSPLLSQDLPGEQRLRSQRIQSVADWTRESIAPPNRAWLESLPFHRRFSPTVSPNDDLLIVHANPKNVDDVIYPDPERQQALYGEVRQRDEDLNQLLDEVQAAALAFGHLHVPSVRRWGSLQLVNVASVSRPVDDDWRAKYAILSWDGAGWRAEHHTVEYDAEAEIAAYEARRPPQWEEEVAALRRR
jgi:predicted phosphodiesterase